MSLLDFYSGRPDKKESGINGLEAGFGSRLEALLTSLPDELKSQVTILSAYRSVEHQQELWDAAVKKYGSEEAARKWVAPPGKSNHGHGHAVDLTYGTDAARKWVHENAARFGLAFNLAHEPWHIEPAGLRSGDYHSSGETYGESDHTYTPGFTSADPEAYTDGQGIPVANDHSLETQMLRVADMVSGRSSTARNGLRVIDPMKTADSNAGRLDIPNA